MGHLVFTTHRKSSSCNNIFYPISQIIRYNNNKNSITADLIQKKMKDSGLGRLTSQKRKLFISSGFVEFEWSYYPSLLLKVIKWLFTNYMMLINVTHQLTLCTRRQNP